MKKERMKKVLVLTVLLTLIIVFGSNPHFGNLAQAKDRGLGNQTYIADPGTQIEDFETLPEGYSTGNYELNKKVEKTGKYSWRLTAYKGGTTFCTRPVSLNLADTNRNISLWVYCETEPVKTLSSVTLYFSSNNFGKYYYHKIPKSELRLGWNHLIINRNEWINIRAEDWANTMTQIRVRIDAQPGQTAVVDFDDLRSGVIVKPQLLITFDDAYKSAFAEGLAYMQTKGLRGTIYVVPAKIDQPGFMHTTDLDDAYKKGWTLANHTIDHSNLATLSTQKEVESKIRQGSQWLKERGYIKGADHLAYPYGSYNETILAALKSVGVKTARTVESGLQKIPPYDNYLLKSYSIQNTTSLDTMKGYVDNALVYDKTVILVFHRIVNEKTALNDCYVSDFRALIDYIAEKHVPCMTIDEWYEQF